MSAFALDWLNLLIRWAHLIAAIGWIGTSFYFIALDLSLRRRERMNPGVAGTAWEVHGGGFYHVEKYMVAPAQLPPDLIWFKWEAYLTWLTGFVLLVVQFYCNAEAWLIDPSVMALSPAAAIAISVISLVVGWLVYDGLCRSSLGQHTVGLTVVVLLFILGATILYTSVFSGRAALIHTGSLLGTLMAVNVFGIIIPNQKKAVAALIAGREPDPRYGAIGKQRSVHNTYLTLPVILFMVSGHYPMLTGHPHVWLLAAMILVGGACARHFLVRHEVGEPLARIAWTLPVILLSLGVAVWLTAPTSPSVDNAGKIDPVSELTVLAISDKHCVSCHATRPTNAAFPVAPKGVMLETVGELRRYAPLIIQHAVEGRSMPLGNMTGMTEGERTQLGAWLVSAGEGH